MRYPVNGRFATPYRAIEIRTLLDRRAKWEPRQMLEVQKDVYSIFSQFLAQTDRVRLGRKAKPSNPTLQEAVDLLRSWNGQMEKGTAAPMVATLVFQELRKAMAERASPGSGKMYEFVMAPSVLEKLLRERPEDWFPDYDALLMKCLADAVEDGAKSQGSKVSRWDYGQFNSLSSRIPWAGQLPLIGSYFNIGPVAMSGSSTTIKQTTDEWDHPCE